MMRITEISRSGSVARFRLEGRLSQHTTAELLGAVAPLLDAGATLLIDVAGVAFADNAGIDALRTLRARGVVLSACSSFLREMLRCDGEAARDGADAAAEARFLRRLRDGDDAAFSELVERHAGRMWATARRLLGSEAEARDALQDAFASAFRNIAAFTGEAKLSSWLQRIAVTAALLRLRSRRHTAQRSIDDLLPRFDDAGGWAQESARLAVSSQELLERRETRAMVGGCIDQLPDPYRTILVLRDLEDLDTEETAEILSLTANAVKIGLHRARQALRTLIERELCRPSPPAVALRREFVEG